jgi:hypothetical protein
VLSALQSLASQSQSRNLEVVVANCCGVVAEQAIARFYPGVKIINLPAETPITHSRDAAIQRASGDVIAVHNERYHAPPNWAERIGQAHETETAEVIAGCIAPSAGLSNVQWAMFLSEYHHAFPPIPSGPLGRAAALMIPGGNVSYKRAALQRVPMNGFLGENELHAALFDRGARFYCDGGLIAEFGCPYTVREYMVERSGVSRDWAFRRAAKLRPISRLASAVSRIALPALIVKRVAAAVFMKRAYRGKFLLALPWIAAFAMVQAWGEIRGYLARRAPGAVVEETAS